jgi:DNA-binding MarR family transcriptional regulator
MPPNGRLVLTPLPAEGHLNLVDALAQLSFAVHRSIGGIAAAHGVSIVQARLLGILRDRRPTINELAGFLGLDKSSVTGLIDRAEDRGLVRRAPSKVDGRSVQVVITRAGQTLFDTAAGAFEAEIAELVAGMSVTDRDRLAALAGSFVQADARRRGLDLTAANNT